MINLLTPDALAFAITLLASPALVLTQLGMATSAWLVRSTPHGNAHRYRAALNMPPKQIKS